MSGSARCGGCGNAFESRRRDHRFCSPDCRLRDLARRRIEDRHQMLTGLDNLRAWLLADIERWERIAVGHKGKVDNDLRSKEGVGVNADG